MNQHVPLRSTRRLFVMALIVGSSTQAVFADGGWRSDDLARMTSADDFHIVPYRDDHVTLGKPTHILPVAVDGELYVRAQEGERSSWYRAALRERGGQITAAGMTRMVAFERVQGEINGLIDAAYRARYAMSPMLNSLISDRASATTVRIRPLGSPPK
jgi:hypothetical protein